MGVEDAGVATMGATTLTRHGITLPTDRIADFCQKWTIRELAIFGSFLRDDFREDSDVDLLIDSRPGERRSRSRWFRVAFHEQMYAEKR